eukprot:TRINITY_DN1127_c1_g1_i2.p7 TRINITY_DN1127_c1_g1~~TRINITY_DN1127_c1_g1_i2.p7  ORF type:complete len:183 (-),score=12.41 TRINITY_DN1127_c1_g1_i2:767-1315(-)
MCNTNFQKFIQFTHNFKSLQQQPPPQNFLGPSLNMQRTFSNLVCIVQFLCCYIVNTSFIILQVVKQFTQNINKMPGTQEVLHLYRSFLREGQKFQQYNMREYVKRRAKLGFKQNKDLQDEQTIQNCWERGLQDLAVVKRQVIIYGLYTRPYKSIMDLKHEEEQRRKQQQQQQQQSQQGESSQ